MLEGPIYMWGCKPLYQDRVFIYWRQDRVFIYWHQDRVFIYWHQDRVFIYWPGARLDLQAGCSVHRHQTPRKKSQN
ncbi:hypothetical protein T484DRAFT_2910935 [Baffinella frigidus]|nr:hypothetical protein T484DRAFT_2910935 [Cryptophyta sp. CCMP2293]